MLAYRAEPLVFARELGRLATLANERATNRLRVLVEVELDPTERVDVASRARSTRAEERYRAAVVRRQDALVRALGHSTEGERGFVNRVNGLPFVSVYADAREIETLGHLPFVVSVTEEGEGQEFLSETVPQIDADFVHPGNTGAFRTVAVIDSGVQTSHPFFGARLVAGACYSSSDYPNNPICAGGAPSGSTTIASGGPCTHVVAGEPAAAGCGHGTHVAGVALGSNATLKGTAPSASLISIQASSLTSNCGGGTSPCRRILESDVINALIRVYDLRNTHPVASVNLSLGITSKGLIDQECHVLYPAMHAAIQQLDAANIPVVAATGNFASPGFQFNDKVAMPACIGDVITVSAVRKDDTYAAEYASANEFIVDLLAPGGSSAAPGPVESSVVGSGYASTVGTSQAAPHVAGAIALMRNVYPYASPRALERQFNESGPLVTLSYGVAGGGLRNYEERRLDVDDAMIGPASPSGGMGAVTVTRHNCYGSNEVSWSVVSGADEYHVEGSASSSFSSPKLVRVDAPVRNQCGDRRAGNTLHPRAGLQRRDLWCLADRQPDGDVLQRLRVTMGSRFWQTLLAGGLCAFMHTASAATAPTTFAAENIQGDDGDRSLVVGPVWYFFHDGSFDAFDVGSRPSSGVQRVVHVGYGGLMRDEFLAAHPDGAFFGVTHGVANQNPELLEFHVRQQELDPVKHRYMSYLARVVPSDDAFVGNDNPKAHEVFDEKGAFQGPIVVELTGASILDAGTRLNDETNIAGFDELGGTDNGIATDEVIREHPGFNGSWGNPSGQPRRILGGVLQYYPGLEEEHHRVDTVLGDFTRPGFRLNRFRLSSRLSSYFSGAWYDPARSGEGFTIAIFDAVAPKLALSWYTYAADDSGRQKWLYGIGTIDDIDATMELFETEGGRMGSTENPQRVVTKRWGTARVGFAYCDAGAVIVEPDDASLPRGAIPIRRATALAAGTEHDCGLGTLSPGIPAPPPF